MTRHHFRQWALASALALTLGTATFFATAQDAPQAASSRLYIVQMTDSPVVAYQGGIPGLRATKPARGKKVNPLSTDVIKYVGYLNAKHDAALAQVGGGRKAYDYDFAFNGFAAELTAAQAKQIESVPGVAKVYADELLQMDTVSTPTFLGLTAPGGTWEQLGGLKNAGEGLIIGIVDSGAWPENPSFSDRRGTNGNFTQDGKLDYKQIPGWHGKCTPGEAFTATNCGQKLIGARWYNAGWGGDAAIDANWPEEFISARDWGGHGSHTASTAAGNNGVDAVIAGTNMGKLSGIAPRARIAAYKVCWSVTERGGGCFGSDSVAAIDQAVSDGVDALNFSISGSRTNLLDAVDVAFLFAADAGIFVAASAGNSGPTVSTVAHNVPWLTTVANGTHDRRYDASVTLGNGATYTGRGTGAAVASSPLISATVAGLPGKVAGEVRACYLGTLDPAIVAGKIVVCDRDAAFPNARVEKSQEVKAKGGVGMVLANMDAGQTLVADAHSVPSVHLNNTDGTAVRTYVAANPGTATASLAASQIVAGVVAPAVSSSSSRGPALASSDLLKPDIMAPGSDILAAVAPTENNFGENFASYSGTSMSSPHIAGIGLLFKQARPTWTPAMIKSALMTTAGTQNNIGGTIAGGPFAIGAGQVRPNNALDPGLVYNAGFNDWFAFLCGTGQLVSAGCAGNTIDPSNLNGASIAIGELTGLQAVTRTVTSVGNQSETYTATVTGLTGITVTLPGSFTIAPGASHTYSVSFERATAAFGSYATGALILTGDKGHIVRSPVVIRPILFAAPAAVSSDGSAINYPITFGYTGPFTATPRGLVPAILHGGTVAQDPDQTFAIADPTTVTIPVSIPAGSTYARFGLFNADVTAGSDIDIYVYSGATLVGSGAASGSNETISFSFATPTAAATPLTVYIHGWGIAGGTTSPFVLHQWYLGTADAGNMSVTAPPAAVQGTTGNINLSFTGLSSATRYLGSVVYGGVAGLPGPTIVRVDTP